MKNNRRAIRDTNFKSGVVKRKDGSTVSKSYAYGQGTFEKAAKAVLKTKAR